MIDRLNSTPLCDHQQGGNLQQAGREEWRALPCFATLEAVEQRKRPCRPSPSSPQQIRHLEPTWPIGAWRTESCTGAWIFGLRFVEPSAFLTQWR